MSFDLFRTKVLKMVRSASGNLSVRFFQNDGNHVALISDGTKIVGNHDSKTVTVFWGSGHKAMARI